MLYLVPTPIGNLEDITLRAIRILKEVDLVLAEDTRTSKKLFSKYSIPTPLESFHAHNEHSKLNHYIEVLKSGKDLALISDAGTPGISDPGFLMARACVHEDVPVECLPGSTAFVPALVMSGLPCDRFHFEGFLPPKKGRQTRLNYLMSLPHTFVLYESPYKIVKTLKQISELEGEVRQCSVSREISKIHAETIRGKVDEVISKLEAKSSIKGEIVIVVGPPPKS